MPHILLLDGNNLGYATLFVSQLRDLSHEGKPTGAVLGTVSSVMRIVSRFKDSIPVVLWDGDPAWRRELYPEYKAHRHLKPEEQDARAQWAVQRPSVVALLANMGVLQLRSASAEADDLAGMITRSEMLSEFAIERITMATADTDWWQGLSDTVDWFSPRSDQIVNLEILKSGPVKDGPFLDTEEYLLAKAISGDPSDNITGVRGLGVQTACGLLRKYGGLQGIVHAVESGCERGVRPRAIFDGQVCIERNLRLMDWRLAPRLSRYDMGYYRHAFEAEACREICVPLGLENWFERHIQEWRGLLDNPGVPVAMDYVESCIEDL